MWRAAIGLLVVVVWATWGKAAEPGSGLQSARSWIQNLSHDVPRVRSTAAKALAEIGGEDAVEPLAERLTDKDADVRLQAAYALGRIKKNPELAIPALTQLLHDQDEHVLYSAQWALGQYAQGLLESEVTSGSEMRPVGGLLAAAALALADTKAPESIQERLREASERILGAKIAVTSATETRSEELEALIEKLTSEDVYVQVQALKRVERIDVADVPQLMQAIAPVMNESILDWKLPTALAKLGPAVAPTILRVMESEDEQLRRLAINVLIELKSSARSALPQLNKILSQKEVEEDYLMTALMAISNCGPAAKESTGLLVKIAVDSEQSELIRSEAMRTLGDIGPEAVAAIPTLKRLLRRSEEPNALRIDAADTIAKISPNRDEAAKLILELCAELEDRNLVAGLATKLAILKAKGAVGVPLLMRLIPVSEIEMYLRQELVLALGEVGPQAAAAIPLLVSLLTNPNEESSIQVAAALTLGKLGPNAVTALGKEFDNLNTTTRLTVARAMVAIGPEAAPAVEALLLILGDEKEANETRTLAAISLGKIGKPAKASITTLTKLLTDNANDEELRAMCAVALGSVDPTSESELQSVFDDSSKTVQVAAAYAVCQLHGRGSEAGLHHLLRLLTDEDAGELASRALIDIGTAAVPLLSAVVLDSQNEFEQRVSCLFVLGQIGQPAAVTLLAALNDEEIAQSAQEGLQCLDDEWLLPQLLLTAEDEDHYSENARDRMRQLVKYFHDGLGAGGDDLSWGQAHPLAKMPDEYGRPGIEATMGSAASGGSGPPLAVMADPGEITPDEVLKTVKVFYGTNRLPLGGEGVPAVSSWTAIQTMALVALTVCLACLMFQTPKNSLAIVACGAGLVVVATPQMLPVLQHHARIEDDAQLAYGGEYSQDVQVGVCEVTIPKIHEPGELEGPSIFRLEIKADPEKHIVVKSVRRMERDAFFTDMEGELAEKGRNVLVFVHGYNVSFDDAARRTAQMASDLKFPGAAAFYSWPSQAHWYKYRLDEQNVAASVQQLKSFLLAVAERSQADTINLVAHSMGNRVLTGALCEIDATVRGGGKLFNQVVLAAPDIDATIFKTQIAPEIVAKAHRTTLYASSKDLALYASRQFNGLARAGDVGDEVVVVPGIETIDASAGDCSLLGHCYYGDSVSILQDIQKLLLDQPAQSRPFLYPVPYNGATYWMFDPNEVAGRERDAVVR